MERLCHDFNLALEESNCGRQERRKLGLRRRTRSAGNLTVCVFEDCSSSSPPQAAPLITQPLSDSDDTQHPLKASLKDRQYCQIGNFESDSFSPTRPTNARRKRKFKKTSQDFTDGRDVSPPIEILSITADEGNPISSFTLSQTMQAVVQANKQKTTGRNIFCGKRKWSHRDRGDTCEMRERSFSGGCSSKSSYFNKNYDFKTKKYDLEKLRKDNLLQPGKIILKAQTDSVSRLFTNTPSLPGSSSFNFVYKKSNINTPNLSNIKGFTVNTDRPSVFKPTTSKVFEAVIGRVHRRSKILNKPHFATCLRNPLNFEDSNSSMDCIGNESSSLSSSDSDGVVTNDSDREGDDELTDWPGIEELKVFNKSLTFKSKTSGGTPNLTTMPPPKRLKKEKFLVKSGWASCKNRFKKKRPKVDDDDMMSDSRTIVEYDRDILQPHASFSTFSDVKNAGALGQDANESFFHSFQSFQEKSLQEDSNNAPRTNFTLQKTSSSDMNLSEKSPQSDHYYSENSYFSAMISEVREIRAGCRRIRDERPSLLILSAANEQLSRFLQDSCQAELKLPCFNDPVEKEKLESLAKLYSLELKVELGRAILKKTSNTTQTISVEHCYSSFPSDHKRRCYGEESEISDQDSIHSVTELDIVHDVPAIQDLDIIQGTPDANSSAKDNFSCSLVDKALLDPGDID